MIKHKLLTLREKTPKQKGIVVFNAWMSIQSTNKYIDKLLELKKDYYILGLCSGCEQLHSYIYTKYPFYFDLIISPNSAYAQSVMVKTNSNANNTIYPLHESCGKFISFQEEKCYDAITVMNLNHIKLWGVFIDLVNSNPDKKFLAVLGVSNLHGVWDRSRKEYMDRLQACSNLTIKSQLPHIDAIKEMAKSKMMVHLCDYDPGAMVVGECLATDTPVLTNTNSSSTIRHFIKPKTGMFCNLSEVNEKFNLMLKYIDENKFSPREWYMSRYGFDNYWTILKKYLDLYGIGSNDLTIEKNEQYDLYQWHRNGSVYLENGLCNT